EPDDDGDGFSACDDCDDADAEVFPGAAEVTCDGVDNDGDGLVDEGYDADGDGWAPCGAEGAATDCDDRDEAVNPDAAEVAGDVVDNDCDGVIPLPEFDVDGDGQMGCDGDCDDGNAEVFPGAQERCNEVDDDCNGFVDDGCPSDLRSELVAIAAGPSLLGSLDADPATCARDPDSDENCDEVPQREIELSAFEV
ncbi:MAG: putative metal-binding motif-containing protein, partial [Phycisphaerae bacterium]|nr:putative metal-binding motif-containing protein [Phycisphaerae bacterium]